MSVLEDRVLQSDMVGLTDWQVSAALHTKDPSLPKKKVRMDTGIVIGILLRYDGVWPAIEWGSQTKDTNGALLLTVLRTLLQTKEIYTDQPAIYSKIANTLANLVSLGIMPQACADEVLALAEEDQSWAEVNNVEVTPRTVGLARGGI